MVGRVPLDLRLAIVSLTPWSDSLFPGADEAIELTTHLESQYMATAGTFSSSLKV